MRIAVVDDSPKDNKILEEYLKEYALEEHIQIQIDSFFNSQLFWEQYFPEKYDIIFLDIYMGEMDGMTVAKTIRERQDNSILIFSTTSEGHAVESYRVRAFYYLLKPYTYEQLYSVLQLCMEAISSHSRYIVVKEGRNQINILLDEIIYTDYSNHYIQIHTLERIIKTYMKFEAFSPLLLQFGQFICCYRNCIVNMDHVEHLSEQGFSMSNHEIIPIRRGQFYKIKQAYTDYIFFSAENQGRKHRL